MEGPQRNELYDKSYERWDEAQQKLSFWYKICKDMYKLYASYANRDKLPYVNKLDIPLGFKIIETLIPYLVSGMPDPGCTPDTAGDARAANRMNAKMKHYLSHPVHLNNMASWYRDALQYGTGIVKDGWRYRPTMTKRWVYNEEEIYTAYSGIYGMPVLGMMMVDPQMILAMAQEGKIPGIEYVASQDWYTINDIITDDRPHFESISPLDCAWLGNSDSVQDLESFFHVIYKTEHELKELIKKTGSRESDYYNLQYVLDHGSEGITNTVSLQNEIQLISAQNDSYMFIEEWRREDGAIWITTTCRSAECVVRRRKSPYFHGQYPFSIIRTFGRGRELIGTPIMKWVDSLIAAVVKLGNEIMENGSLAVNPPFLKRPGSKYKHLTLALAAGKIIPSRPDDIKQLEIKDVRPASLNMLTLFIGFLETITGVDDIVKGPGGPTTPNTAGGVEMLQFQSTARTRLQQYIDTIGMADLYTRIASNIDQYKREPIDIFVPIPGGQTRTVPIRPSDTQGNYKFIPDVRSMLATNNSVARAQLQSLLNIAIGLQETYKDANGNLAAKRIVDIKYLTKKLFSMYDTIDNPQKALIDPADTRAIPPELAMAQGQVPGPGSGGMPGMPGMPQAPQMPQQGQGMPGMGTATGTRGMPPQLGGTQQPGIFSPSQVPMPKRSEDAIRSAMSIQ